MHNNYYLSPEEHNSVIKVSEWLESEKRYLHAQSVIPDKRAKPSADRHHHLDKGANSSAESKTDTLTISPREHAGSEAALSSLLNFHFSWSEKPKAETGHLRKHTPEHNEPSIDFTGIWDAAFEELLGTARSKADSEDQPAAQGELHSKSDEGSSTSAALHEWESRAMMASWRARSMSSQEVKDDSKITMVYMF
ncbi:hypothetical protein GUITHDRAFT_142532 [Guillardia theta CCMP2712]|uniref:Uncharacterized protein n=2 Tax=Guillardia theta TaxID=55529 RepID=L1IWK8_GUITC|nr:hypothetical protein GUITHDRAFT_142532 [Guillardia theta CCMP2712]EKX40653.1 hypothetical protein GUITHDRAFT_142532 [Guillardia theta CCMP2712]|mmetsp:Transcript_31181/g.100040  ORF Transcript_31181/g.100040 Transcript_31181/m.100040 type:complete len:194 (+) Transcript_31181:66-647(+)|eukprot:XP_005827633.1 hypothetical protein GUITHDRAFT_142532 [Guillardia theta CCMP2712]